MKIAHLTFLAAASVAAGCSSDATSATAFHDGPSATATGTPGGATQNQPPEPATQSVTFTETPEDFPNPERGMYRVIAKNLDALTVGAARTAYADGYRLLSSRINLAGYRDSDLPAEYLAQLQGGFDAARAAGVKLIIRPVYNYPSGETEYHSAQDAPLARVLSHIEQLKPLLQRNADVIGYVQAGFIGAWGEWHTSSNNLTSEQNRTEIKNALLLAVPDTRFVQFRYPPYIREWNPTLPTLSAALDGRFRTGFHNDCFLASATDVGTYSADPVTQNAQRDYTARLGTLAPFGGETCNPADESGATARSDCAAILAEGARYALTYLNMDYYRPLFHDRWIAGGCMAEVQRRMGYRIGFTRVAHPSSVPRGSALSLDLGVRNSGWARIYNAHPLNLLLRDDNTGKVWRIAATGADPRAWTAGSDATASASFAVPASIPTGQYSVFLALPDGSTPLTDDPRYAIRPANANVSTANQYWDSQLGAFRTGTVVTVN